MKLESTELRICNYVSITQSAHKDDVEAVTSFMLQQIENGYKVFGIPLTEDILLKCGFKKDNYGTFYFEKFDGVNDLWLKIQKNNFGVAINLFHQELKPTYLKDIEFLHSLQNLIHSLTNEELNINL